MSGRLVAMLRPSLLAAPRSGRREGSGGGIQGAIAGGELLLAHRIAGLAGLESSL